MIRLRLCRDYIYLSHDQKLADQVGYISVGSMFRTNIATPGNSDNALSEFCGQLTGQVSLALCLLCGRALLTGGLGGFCWVWY